MLRVSRQWCLVICLAGLLGVTPAVASTWCGQNGVVTLSFTDGDSLSGVASVAPDDNNLTIVDLYAVLTGVEPVARNQEAFLGIGGFELKLHIEGAEGIIQKQELAYRHINAATEMGACQVGILPGLTLEDGRATLVHWQILFIGQPRNVVFRLDPEGLLSCASLPGCEEAQPYCLYTGTRTAKQAGDLFGAGYVPAYLNWEGDAERPATPDLEPVVGSAHWSELGIYSAR